MRSLLLLLLATLPAVASAAPWVVITEIHYHPPGPDAEAAGDEFIEILSREPPRVDLAGWRLEGAAQFQFPGGAVIQAGEYLVLARDPALFAKRHPQVRRILGPYTGALDRRGGRVTLRNAGGGTACELHYGTRGKWPVSPGGTGHTLSILDPYLDPSDPRNWAASRRVGGSPGAANFPREEPPSTPLVKKGAVWRYRKGDSAPDHAWRELAFDDSSWASGPSGFGYADGDDATVLDDMKGKYFTLYTRRVFEVKDLAALARLVLRADYDDGFVAYLNGKEVARGNMGAAGSAVAFNQPAPAPHEAGVPAEFDLGPASRRLKAGKNVIAVEVHNDKLGSSDLSLSVELLSRDAAAGVALYAEPLINEVRAGGKPDGSYIEVFNAGPGEIDLGGHWLTDEPGSLKKLQIQSPAVVHPRGFKVFTRKELGEKLALRGPDIFIALTEPGGTKVLDAMRLDEKKKLPPDRPRGRFPDGSRDLAVLDEPTPGAPNRLTRTDDVVINEILYHSITGSEDDEFIELHDRGAKAVSLDGFRLTGAVRYGFSPGAAIQPGGYLVIAKNPEALAAKYGLARDGVLGPYEGSLSAKGEELVLRDAPGNIANRVAYADRDPWPRWADGLGSSLELIDPAVDNSLPGSWAASDARAQAKWETFSYTKEHRDFEGHNVSELQFMLLDAGECLIDDVKLSGAFADTFEKGGAGWSGMGTHERSGIYQGDGAQGQASIRIVADGRGNARNNYVTRAVPGGLVPSKSYTLSFRARWQRGSPLLLTRTPGQGLARLNRLAVPARLGTPGAENSTRAGSAAPVIGTPAQQPVAPSSGQPVTVSARISARTPLKSALIHYRHERNGDWAKAALADDGSGLDRAAGDGVWTGQIPGLPAGNIAFYLSATDDAGKEGTFPTGAPARTALYAAGMLPSPKFPTYTLLVTDSERDALSMRMRMSNRLVDATLVYGDSRIFYNVGVRRRGSPFTRSNSNWRIVFGAETLDGRATLTIDGQGGDGTRLNERLTYWLVDQLHAPNARQQYVYFRFPGEEEGIYEDVQKVDGKYLSEWFDPPAAADGGRGSRRAGAPSANRAARVSSKLGSLFKVDDYWELSSGGEQAYREADFHFTSQDPEDYRWNFPPRGDGFDLAPILKLVHLLDERTTQKKAFEERVEKLVDVDEWLRVLAARALADDWDSMGRARGKNAFLYLPPSDHRWRLLPWDCDLAWQQNPSAPLFSGKFPGIQRLLAQPQYRRRYLGYLAYLAERELAPDHFGGILADLNARSGAATERFRWFAEARRAFVLRQIPRRPFRVKDVSRVERAQEPELVRVSGTAPANVMRFRLDKHEGSVEIIGEDRWIAEIPVGPEGDDLLLEALDFGGNRVASAMVKVLPRPGALSPRAEEPAPVQIASPTQDESLTTTLDVAEEVDTSARPTVHGIEARPRAAGKEARGFSWKLVMGIGLALALALGLAKAASLALHGRRGEPPWSPPGDE